jgi:hypothetical protein
MPLSLGKLKFLAYRRRQVYRKVFETEEGQEVLVDLMEHCGWGKDLFNENTHQMSALVGRRQVLLHIKAVLKATDEQLEGYVQQHQERFDPFDDN